MNNSDKIKFLETMNGLADIFNASLTEIGLKMRFDALKQYSIKQVTEAATIIVKTRKYTTMPGPADFIEAIEGNPDEKADIQKSIVMEAYNRYNPDHKFKDQTTQGVIDKIGWRKIGQVNFKEIPFLLKDFREMYKSFDKVASRHVLKSPPELKGLISGLTKRIK